MIQQNADHVGKYELTLLDDVEMPVLKATVVVILYQKHLFQR